MQFRQLTVAFLLIFFVLQVHAAETKYVAVETANVRVAPNGNVTDRIHRGDPVQVHEQDGAWSRISAANSPARWVHSDLLCASQGCWVTYVGAGQRRSQSSRSSLAPSNSYRSSPTQNRSSTPRPRPSNNDASCPCSGSRVCVGPRGGRYCITSGGNKRYGV